MTVAVLGRPDGLQGRIWTQLAFRKLASSDPHFQEAYSRLSLALLSLRYEFTSISTNDALAAARQTRWDVSVNPFKGVVDLFGRPRIQGKGLLPIAMALLKEVWFDPVLGIQSEFVTHRILDRLERREDGLAMARALLQHADALFGLHVIGAKEFKRVVRQRLSFWRQPMIVVPH